MSSTQLYVIVFAESFSDEKSEKVANGSTIGSHHKLQYWKYKSLRTQIKKIIDSNTKLFKSQNDRLFQQNSTLCTLL